MTAIRAGQASVISQLPVKLRAAAEHNAARPFRLNVPEEALVDHQLDTRLIHARQEEKEMRKFIKDPTALPTLAPEQLHVTQQSGTEAPGTGEYLDNKEPGIYVDIVL